MLSRSLFNSVTRSTLKKYSAASLSTAGSSQKTIADALKFSGYSEIDFTIKEDQPVYEAVQKFAGFNIGCLVTVDAAGTRMIKVPTPQVRPLKPTNLFSQGI